MKRKIFTIIYFITYSFILFAQSPSISYGNTGLVFYQNEAMQPMIPTNKGGVVPDAIYGTVSTVAGGWAGMLDGTLSSARFNQPYGLCFDQSGNLIVVERSGSRVRKIDLVNNQVLTIAGDAGTVTPTGARVDGQGTAARFNQPTDVTIDEPGNLYVTDMMNNVIRKISPDGIVSTFAGSGTQGYLEGSSQTARFYFPFGICVGKNGNLLVADRKNNRLREINISTREVSCFAGSAAGNNSGAIKTGTSFSACMNEPFSVKTDASGNIYVSTYVGGIVRKIDLSALSISTLAGTYLDEYNTSRDEVGLNASFTTPNGIAVDKMGDVFVAENNSMLTNNKIRRISQSGVVTTLAGSGDAGNTNGVGRLAQFRSPTGIASDGKGNVYVADAGNHAIRKIVATGYAISPALPEGMTIDGATGVISGVPTVTANSRDYIVTAYNAYGKSETTITLAVAKRVDSRNIENPYSIIPDFSYADQGYVTIAQNGDWVSVMTTGTSTETVGTKYIISSISKDKGKSWSALQILDDNATWAVSYTNPLGRVFAIYNKDRKFWFKFSDDNGVTWSTERYMMPVRWTSVDENNDLGNGLQYFWSVSKPFSYNNIMYLSFTKYRTSKVEYGEGWLFLSSNINTETDPTKISFINLPQGDVGVLSPVFGKIQEEHTSVVLSNGNLFMNFRTQNGYIGSSYSRNSGATWTIPEYMTYASGGFMKNPRACPRLFKCKNGKYLMWYHNTNKIQGFYYRNPAWISGGIEHNGIIEWSDPELLLYSTDTLKGMSYPDLIEADGKYWITTTEKTICSVHQIDNKLIDGLWNQKSNNTKVTEDILLEESNVNESKEIRSFSIPSLDEGAFTIDVWLNATRWQTGEVILDDRDENGDGWWLWVSSSQTICFSMKQGTLLKSWENDAFDLPVGVTQHFVFIIDGNANIISTVVNGKFNDGGSQRLLGWCRFDKNFTQINTSNTLRLIPAFSGTIKSLRLYKRHLTTSEAIGNYRYGAVSTWTNEVLIKKESIVSSISGNIKVECNIKDFVRIYSTQGVLVASFTGSGDYACQPGFYLVKVGSETHKIVHKE
ncbi:MAG: exo-alpha-sialidase [Paludibacter sp.]|nr:exo-alpha-sialidase [Paludibacter sp.]